ncbi:MAG: amidohydrolase family protein, partial [Chlorobia bacterium]|nr:amidohydrolase family protein [Fimbriimonadaceae bacterium]
TPDGRNVLFNATTYERGLDTAIRMHEPDDGLESAEIGRGPRFSPNFLKMVPTSGGAVKQLIAVPGGYFFLKDPERLYVVQGAGINSMRLDGTDVREIVKFSGATPTSGINSATLSPDGTKALFNIDFKLYTVNIPLAGQVVTLGSTGGVVPAKKLSQDGGDNVEWTADGKGVFWSMGNKAYIQDLDAEKPTVIDLKVEVPRHTPKGKVLLRGARLVTMKGDEVINSGDILVIDNRIAKIGPKGSFPVPPDAKVMPMEGKTISPGYVDTHSHWFGNRETAYPMSWAYVTNLAYGVTTNRDPQSGGDGIYDFADAIEAGLAPGPRIYTTGPGVFNGGGMEDKDAVFANLKRYKEAYDTKTIKEYVSGDRMVIEWVAMACKEFGLTPTTEGALESKRYLAEASSGYSGHEHALPHALYDDMAQFMAKTRTFYTPTLLVTYGGIMGENYWFSNYDLSKETKIQRFVPMAALDEVSRRRPFWALEEEYFFKQVAESCKRIVDAGGKVGVGCHGQFQGLGNHWEMWMLAQGGMTPLQVLRCASLFGAEAIGLDQDLGSLEAGKLADLVIYDKNPLENIRNTNTIHWVMKNGELFEADTMNTVYPVAKKFPNTYWDSLRPPFVGKP